MIYDFIEVSNHFKDKDMIKWGNLEYMGMNSKFKDKEFYSLKGCREIEFVHYPRVNNIVMKGSPAYFWQGHNFNFSISSFADSINHINGLLGINLWTGFVEKFEIGLILQVPEKPSQYIARHREGGGQTLYNNPKYNGHFRAFSDANINRKLYDARRNIVMKQGYKIQKIIQDKGWNPEGYYIKYENHYKKPEILNSGRSPILAEILSPAYQSLLKESLINEYNTLYKMKEIEIPTNKKFLTTPDIFALELIREKINQGCTIAEVKKGLFKGINEIPEGTLSRTDKDARKRQINAIFQRIEVYSNDEKWDLTNLIKEVLLSGSPE